MDFDIMNVQVEDPKTDFNDYSFTIYGVAGIGKTTLAGNLFDDPSFWQFEQGQNTLKAKKVPVPDWKKVKEYIKKLTNAHAQGLPMPFKTSVWDTVDVASKLCQDYVCKQNGWEHPADGDYGAGWDAIKTEWTMTVKALEDIGIKVVFIAHDNDKEFKRKDGSKYNQTIPSASKSFLGVVVDKVDFVIYCDKTVIKDDDGNVTEKRMMHFRETSEYVAKSHLMYMPEHIEFADTPRDTAQRLIDAFNEASQKEFGEIPVDTKKPEINKKTTRKEKDSEKVEKGEKADKSEKVEKTPEQPKADNDKPESLSLDEVKKLITDRFMHLYENKIKQPTELNQIIKDTIGKERIGEIETLDEANKLLEVMQSI